MRRAPAMDLESDLPDPDDDAIEIQFDLARPGSDVRSLSGNVPARWRPADATRAGTRSLSENS
jgi:hypothetical protein